MPRFTPPAKQRRMLPAGPHAHCVLHWDRRGVNVRRFSRSDVDNGNSRP